MVLIRQVRSRWEPTYHWRLHHNDPDITDANPITIYVSAFYMDVTLVNYGLWSNVYTYATNQGYSFLGLESDRARDKLSGEGGDWLIV